MSKHSEVTLKDRGRGQIQLTLRDGVVVGAMGSEPKRFIGLTLEEARRLARSGRDVSRSSLIHMGREVK